jgi:hypothetical protein
MDVPPPVRLTLRRRRRARVFTRHMLPSERTAGRLDAIALVGLHFVLAALPAAVVGSSWPPLGRPAGRRLPAPADVGLTDRQRSAAGAEYNKL